MPHILASYPNLCLSCLFLCKQKATCRGEDGTENICYLLASLQEEQQVKECLHLALPTEFVDQLKERNMKTKQRGECVRQKKKGGKREAVKKKKK